MLPSGQSFQLTTQPDSDDSYKHCILVKLTDSSFKAIEEYLKNKNSKKPSIVFQRDKGEFHIPVDSSKLNSSLGDTGLNSGHFKRFHFALSSVKESHKDSSASFECISYSNSKLKTIGTVEQKLTVLANEELFQATKEKVISVAEEEKKNSTIEIKPSGAIVNRNSSISSGLNNMGVNRPKQPQQSMNKTNPLNSSLNTSGSANNQDNKPRPPVIDRPIRERLIHLLALRPCAKSEIIQKFSIPEKDKESFDLLLQAVANFNQKTLKYDIANEIFLNEVKEDWQFYNPNERANVKQNLNRVKQNMINSNLNQPAKAQSSLGSSSFNLNSKASANSAFFPFQQSSTRTNPESSASDPQPKQIKPVPSSANPTTNKISPNKYQKINNQSQNNNLSKSDGFYLSPDSEDLSFEHLEATFSNNTTSNKNKQPPEIKDNHQQNDYKTTSINNNQQFQTNKKAKFNANNTINNAKQSMTEIETNELTELSKKYRPIQNKQQSDQYKKDYNQVHDEYVQLHNYIESVEKVFNSHKAELELINDPNSKEFQEKKEKIIQDFKQRTTEYTKNKERYLQVYTKLSFLNDLIKQFESNNLQNSNVF